MSDETYCAGRFIHDADSHLVEDPAWLRRYVDPSDRHRVGMLDLHGLESAAAVALNATGVQAASSLSPVDLMRRKNFDAVGGFDPVARSAELNLLGFRSQLVFSTYSHLELLTTDSSIPSDLGWVYSLVDAHNTGVADFCKRDPRLLAAAFVATHDATRAATSAERALAAGCAGIEVPSVPQGTVSLAHPTFDRFFGLIEDAQVPLLFHVGGGGKLVPRLFAGDGDGGAVGARDPRSGSAIASLTYMGMPAPVEMAIAVLVLNGVFERFPKLQCGVIEQGATWIPGFLRRLDSAAREFGRARQLQRLKLSPSDYCLRQLKVTPFPFEDIAWLISETGSGMYMFGSDYPHDEGGEQPLELFDAALASVPAGDQEDVWFRNFEALMGRGLPPGLRHAAGHVEAVGTHDTRVTALDTAAEWNGEPIAVHRKKILLRLLAREAAARLGLRASEGEMQDAIDAYRRECGLEDIDDALRWMDDMAVSDESMGRFAQDAVLTSKIEGRLVDVIESELGDHLRVASGRSWRDGRESCPHDPPPRQRRQ